MPGKPLKLPPFGIKASLILFGVAALVLFVETQYLIPFLTENTNQEMIVWWFLVSGFGLFIPLVILAFIILKQEGNKVSMGLWRSRLLFRKITGHDWLWTFGGFVLIGGLSYLIMMALQMLTGSVDHQPPFMRFEPLSVGRYWILALWFPYWIFNIMGEEILWRGVILPRQQVSLGKYAWIVNGLGWGIFHIAFGWQLLITLLPILFILPYITQRRQNTWIGVILHAALNGPSFVAIALGVL